MENQKIIYEDETGTCSVGEIISIHDDGKIKILKIIFEDGVIRCLANTSEQLKYLN